MTSNWQATRARSLYHFDNQTVDAPGEWWWPVHHFTPTWQNELAIIMSQHQHRPINWQTRKYTNGRTTESPDLAAEEWDIESAGGDPKMHLVNSVDDFTAYPELQRIIDWFGLDQTIARLHLQFCGQVWNQHIDKLDAVYQHEDPTHIRKFIVMLTPWEPGHYYNYGTAMYQHWRAGDAHEFDWRNIPHGTANSSYRVRASLNIMGIDKERKNAIKLRSRSSQE